MHITLKGQYATVEVKVEDKAILSNKGLTKAIVEHLKETLIDLEKELKSNNEINK